MTDWVFSQAEWPQTALDPAGPHAASVHWLHMGMLILMVAVVAITMLALVVAWFVRLERSPVWIIWTGGLAFPLVVLVGLIAVNSDVTRAVSALAGPDELVIEVTGKQFWWDVRYPAEGGQEAIRTANEIHIPTGRPVRFRLLSDDVIHSFWVPALGGKRDMIPGRENELVLVADRPGRFRGQCAEFCGQQHARMALEVVAHAPAAFEEWRDEQTRPRLTPDHPQHRAGRQAFSDLGCAACHEIRGVAEGGRLGPDLSNYGERDRMGAGIWPNTIGNTAGWIVDVQRMKPGAEMPSYTDIDGPTLRAVAAYLQSLR
jgi:cytochrome c oxidase subunit 2